MSREAALALHTLPNTPPGSLKRLLSGSELQLYTLELVAALGLHSLHDLRHWQRDLRRRVNEARNELDAIKNKADVYANVYAHVIMTSKLMPTFKKIIDELSGAVEERSQMYPPMKKLEFHVNTTKTSIEEIVKLLQNRADEKNSIVEEVLFGIDNSTERLKEMNEAMGALMGEPNSALKAAVEAADSKIGRFEANQTRADSLRMDLLLLATNLGRRILKNEQDLARESEASGAGRVGMFIVRLLFQSIQLAPMRLCISGRSRRCLQLGPTITFHPLIPALQNSAQNTRYRRVGVHCGLRDPHQI